MLFGRKKCLDVDELSIMMLEGSQGLEQGVEKKVLQAISKLKDVNEKGQMDGRTLAIHCSVYNYPVALCALIDRGADINLQDNDGFTALHAAVLSGNINIAQILLNHGAKCDIKDRWGNTPLLRGSHKDAEMIKLLIDFGCDPNTTNNYGVSAFDKMRAYPEIMKIMGRENSY